MIVDAIADVRRLVPHEHINALAIALRVVEHCLKSMAGFMRSFAGCADSMHHFVPARIITSGLNLNAVKEN